MKIACCDPVVGGPPTSGATVQNVGGQLEWYVNGTASPFDFRTLETTGDVFGTQNANTIEVNHSINLVDVGTGQTLIGAKTSVGGDVEIALRKVIAGTGISIADSGDALTIANTVPAGSCANVGAGAQVYVVASANPFQFRTIRSSDASVSVTQNVNDIDLTVAAMASFFDQLDYAPGFFSTTSSTFVTAYTSPAFTCAIGETWGFFANPQICHPNGVPNQNTVVSVQLETAAAVFTEIQQWSTNAGLVLGAGEQSPPIFSKCPHCR